ncbi:hypothetical protein JV46_15570 [Solemya velum gill symbiont]|uniref:Purine nucleoside phosphorylase n=1 Tax=Solemya velum gill symbiont TaxID=2340 RepID=A0A0B0HC31_SOVGS|nr:hypothetical protein JV46_15570 [Solemya velum gill symbiont]
MPDRIVRHDEIDWIEPDWPVPASIRAISTMRHGGVSAAPWASLNLGDHVGDDSQHVAHNRAELIRAAEIPAEPHWLRQVHGCDVVETQQVQGGCDADAACSFQSNEVCVVMTADCLPVLICDRSGTMVAAAHAGWRGLCDGVLEAAIAKLDSPAENLMAWLGPAISQQAFEVGEEVRDAFIARDSSAQEAFIQNQQGRWMADIYQLARQRLESAGVADIYGGNYCTFTEESDFFSYRRDGITGRMASMIWIES